MLLYNLGIWLYLLAVRAASPFNRKAKLWTVGRKDIFMRLRKAIDPQDRIVWIHAASLGEFEQGRPLIDAIRAGYPEFKILLTFFSPSGYEVRKDYASVDYVFYLPADTRVGARKFLDIVRPEITVFIKYEFWLNYLQELKSRKSRTFVVSANFRQDSVFFKWYGGLFRRALVTFEHIFVQDDKSRELLAQLGYSEVTVAGDTRFDRVAAIAGDAPDNEIVERFCRGSRVLVAGSTWLPDEEVVISLKEKHPRLKLVIVPHEIGEQHISELVAITGGVRYTMVAAGAELEDEKVMIVDTIGILSSLYKYGWLAYVGGGFGVGIHNTLEAVTFGLPVAFGPNYGKFREAVQMVGLGIATSIKDASELDLWVTSLENDREKYDEIKCKAQQYVDQNRGATEIIMKKLFR